MIPYTYSIYGINTTDYTAGVSPIDSAPSGTLLNDHYTLDVFANNTDPLYSANRSKKFDESLYLWHIGAESAVGTNAAYCIEASNTLNLEVSMNKVSNVPLACQLTNITNNRFQRTAQGRMCYDYFYSGWCDYLYSRLFVDINRTAFCARPVCQVYDKSTNQATTQSIQNVAAYINQNPTNRYVYAISFEMYNSVDMPRTRQQSYIPGRYSNEKGVLTFDILTDRPIPSNATALKNDMLYHYSDNTPHNDYVTDKCYSPFTQVSSGLWYSGASQTFNPYYIGFRTARNVNELINGFGTATHGGKVTGAFVRYSDKIQDFNDVKYKWRTNVYYNAGGVFLDNGFPLNSLTSTDTINIFSSIEILDKKGFSDGAAIQAAVKHECAFYGFYFADNLDDAQNAVLGTSNTHIYLPEIVGGVTTGNYFTGDEIPDVPYAGSTSVGDGHFDFDETIGTEDNETHIPTEVTAIPRFNRTYLCDLNDIDNFMGNLKSFDWSLENLNELFFGQDPYEFIISLSAFPLVSYPLSPAATKHDITLGKLNLNDLPDKVGDCEGYPIMGGIVQLPNPFGSITVPKFYSLERNGGFDFLDYEPYTKIMLYLPYCGMVSIPPSVFMGKELKIDMSWDTLSGNIICYILVENGGVFTEYTTAQGNILTDVPVSGRAYSEYMKAQTDMTTDMITGLSDSIGSVAGHVAGASVSATFGNPLGVGAQVVQGVSAGVSGTARFIRNYYELTQTQPSPITISNGSASIGTGNDQDAHLYVLRPILPDNFDAETFTKVNGRATGYAAKLRTSSGFTQMINPILDGINCTAEEKMLIIQALADGVIL